MSYDLDTMVEKFRREMEDTVEPYLWSDDEVVDFLGEAQDEFTQRVDALADELALTYTASDLWLTIPWYVTRVRDAENDLNQTVELYNHEEWQEAIKTDDYGMFSVATNWKIKVGTVPEALITNIKSGAARMYPIPSAGGTVTLTVFRRPLKSLEDSGTLEVTDQMHQRCFLKKAKAIAYRKHDAEAFNPKLAEELEVMFDTEVEEMRSRVQRTRRRARTVAYGGL